MHVLDRSRARVRTLVAGPGYGKTVLLEQWAPSELRRLGWYRARRSAADVAVVARGLQAAAAPILPGAGRRLLERLSVTEDPEREAVLLGEMLAEDLAGWPDDAWIVIDDYHHLAVAEASERFVEVLVQRSPVQLLLASRVRPLWVQAKSLLYGEILEVTQSMLAMTTEEAEQVLEGGRLDLSSGLLTLADGWPAVIGLAGMAPDVTEIDADMPDTLYAFFAEELYRGLEPSLAEALGILAAMPSLDRELAAELLGPDRAIATCEEALSLGIVDEREGRLEFHPLGLERWGATPTDKDFSLAAQHFVVRRDWDAALDTFQRQGLLQRAAAVLDHAMEELAREGRLREVARWLAYARQAGVSSSEASVAEAEMNLRHGRHLTALTTARAVAFRVEDTRLRFRAFLVGARAAHIGSHEEEALEFYKRAATCSPNPRAHREARWGELMCLSALEREDSHSLLAELVSTTFSDDPVDLVRMVDKQFSVGFRFGRVHDISDGFRVIELLAGIEDPLIRISFRSMFAWALVLSAHFDESHRQAELLLADATEYRVDPALPYGYSNLAISLAGQRRFGAAYEAIDESARAAIRIHDENGIQNAYALRTRILLQAGEIIEACATEPPDVSRALPSMRGEVLASRALALASLGQLSEAVELARRAQDATRGVEAQQVGSAAQCVVAVKSRREDQLAECSRALEAAFTSGALEPFVTAYRCNKDLLSVLLSAPAIRDLLIFMLRRAGDESAAQQLGYRSADLLDPVESLSRREREVYDLVCQGLSNAEIARALFIAESTAKLHVHHVYDKLGIRSRAGVILNAARRSGGVDGSHPQDG